MNKKEALTLNNYEVVVILHPDTSLEEQKNIFRKNQETIKSFSGAVNTLETWGKRNLMNPINKCKKGIYFHSTFQAASGAVAELERIMKISDRVLRFVHTRLDNRIPLSKFVEAYKKGLADTAQREREREAKALAKKQAAQAAAQAGM
jgi:small subunit ribosomal protein S6